MKCYYYISIGLLFLLPYHQVAAQCGSPGKEGNQYALSQFPNTYYQPASSSYVLTKDSSATITVAAAGIASNAASPHITPGDLIMIIQMQGAAINTSNNASYGGNNNTGGGYISDANLLAGNYEYAVAAAGTSVTASAGGTIVLTKPVKNNYLYRDFNASSGQYRFQVIKVPQFQNIGLTDSIAAPAWNGRVGGVIVIEVSQTCNLNGYTISADGKGFRGGGGKNYTGTSDFAAYNIYRYSSTVTAHASKAEGIAGTPRFVFQNGAVTDNSVEGYPNGSFGKGAPANAGGGATDNKPAPTQWDNQYNTGGGGGGHAGRGGKGGWPWNNAPGTIDSTENGGRPGAALALNGINRIYMGGGGGAGCSNNSASTDGAGSSGAAGGGIVIVRAYSITGSGRLTANGAGAVDLSGSGIRDSYSDASGGGGAGGTVLAFAMNPTGLSNITVSAKGGKGGSNYFGQHGPGGGGGGGYIVTNGTIAGADVSGGANGQTGPGTGNANRKDSLSLNYGATPGQPGMLVVSTDSSGRYFCTVLAQSAILLRARPTGHIVQLIWSAPADRSIKTFMIEHSTDLYAWNKIADIPVVTDTAYHFTHNNPVPGSNFYRLQGVAAGGQIVYSNIAMSEWNGTGNDLTVCLWGNKIHIIGRSLLPGKYTIRVLDQTGMQVQQNVVEAHGDLLQVPMEGNLGQGYYIVQVTGSQGVRAVKKMGHCQ